MRFRDNAWRPIPGKEKIYNSLDTAYTAIYHHVQDNIDNYIGYVQSTGDLYLINMSLGTGSLIKTYTTDLANVKVQFLKRFMLVLHSTGIDKYLYDATTGYTLMNIAYPPASIDLVASSSHQEITASVTLNDADALLGEYRKSMIEASENYGHLSGGIMWRIAYKLYDGSYVMHTIPRYLQIATNNGMIEKLSGSHRIKFWNAYIYATITRTYYQSFASMKDIISSIVIFCSKNEPLYKIDEFTLTDSILAGVTTNKYFGQLFTINDDYKKLADPSGWYKVHEIPFLQACDIYKGDTDAINMKGFYLDYASRENMPVDNFTAHSLTAHTSFEYNDRLILGDVNTIFGENTQHSLKSDYQLSEYSEVTSPTRLSYLLFVISTDSGIIYKLQSLTGNYMNRTDDSQLVAVFDNSVIGYPDSRCTEIRLIVEDSGQFYMVHSFSMSKSANDNYSYYHNSAFSGDSSLLENGIVNFANIVVEVNFTSGNEVNLETYANKDSFWDMNRIQVSELRNPYYYPAKNSYQVGSGQIIGVGTNTEPISEGQFGQYPLYVFTNKGIWMLQQGTTGEVVFVSVSPVSGEVANTGQIISVGNGVVFSDDRGLHMISGKQTTRLSQMIEGPVIDTFRTNNHFNYMVNHASLVQLRSQISTVDFLDFVGSAIFGFDKVNNELIVSNNSYDYSYVFNFESNTWHKISQKYTLFISDYPDLLAISSEGVINLSSETGTSEVSVLIATQPQSLSLPEVYKKIERMVLRCLVETKLATSITFGIWATDDLKTFQFITGSQRTGEIQNILFTRSHNSNKFYVIAVFGQFTADSQISAIDYSVTPRFTRKLMT